jgi:peptidyl-dipeptidase Dcp
MTHNLFVSFALSFAITFVALLSLSASPQQPASPQTSAAPVFDASNPFAKPSTLPFQAPPFDKIKDSDFQPALEEGMKQELAEAEAVANNPDAPTFVNTIEAMERSGDLLRRVQRVFSGLSQSNTNPSIQKVQTEEAPKFAAHRDAIYLNPKLFARVKTVYDQREKLGLNAEAIYLVERYYRDFVRAGALLPDADKDTMRALNK